MNASYTAPTAGTYAPTNVVGNSNKEAPKLRFELAESEVDVDVNTGTTLTFSVWNTSGHETSHKIWVTCEDNPFWDNSWFSFDAFDPQPVGATSKPLGASAEPSRAGLAWKQTTLGQMLEVRLTNNHRRDIQLRLAPGTSSQARAGRYGLQIHIESHGHLNSAQVSPEDDFGQGPVTFDHDTLHVVATILPFYDWNARITPVRARVGLFRRKTDLKLHIVNAGNDWIYLDVAAPEAQEAQWSLPSRRLCVPPANMGDRDFVRDFPVGIRTFKKLVRGAEARQPLDLTVRSLDAPSVRPRASVPQGQRANGRGAGAPMAAPKANFSTGVVSGLPPELGESRFASPSLDPLPLKKAGGAELIYRPLIPASVGGVFKTLRDNAVAIVMGLIGLSVAFTMLYFFVQIRYNQALRAVMLTQVSGLGYDARWQIEAPYLIGSEIQIVDPRTLVVYRTIIVDPRENGVTAKSPSVRNALKREGTLFQFAAVRDTNQAKEGFDVSKRWPKLYVVPLKAGVPYRVRIRRPVPIIGSLLSASEAKTPLFIELPKTAPTAPPPLVPVMKPLNLGNKAPGTVVKLQGQNLGTQGEVFIGDQKVVPEMVDWKPDGVSFTIPTSGSAQGTVDIQCQPKGSSERLIGGTVTIVEPTPEPTQGGDASSGNSSGSSSGGSSSNDSSEGTSGNSSSGEQTVPTPIIQDGGGESVPMPTPAIVAEERPQLPVPAPEPRSRRAKPFSAWLMQKANAGVDAEDVARIKREYPDQWQNDSKLTFGWIELKNERVIIGTKNPN